MTTSYYLTPLPPGPAQNLTDDQDEPSPTGSAGRAPSASESSYDGEPCEHGRYLSAGGCRKCGTAALFGSRPAATTGNTPKPPAGECPKHGTTARDNCRGCGTTARQAAAAVATEAAEAQRTQERRDRQAARDAHAAAKAAASLAPTEIRETIRRSLEQAARSSKHAPAADQ